MNPFLRYLADKNSAHTQTDRQTDRHTHTQTDRHTPMTTRPCGLRRAGNQTESAFFSCCVAVSPSDIAKLQVTLRDEI